MSGERKEDALKKRQSVYSPYYAKIQDLLFQGMPVKEVWLYMRIYFDVYACLRTFQYYIKTRHLTWFIPSKTEVKRGRTDRIT